MTSFPVFLSPVRSTPASELIVWPMPPAPGQPRSAEMDVYVRFMRHLRVSSYSRDDLKILSSIQFVADMTGADDAEVALQLVDLGLRAPRSAFPAVFLEQIEHVCGRAAFEDARPGPALCDLLAHWQLMGDNVVPAAGPQTCATSLPTVFLERV